MNENMLKELNDLVLEEEEMYGSEELEKMKANGKATAQRLFMAFTNITSELRESESATETAAFLNEMLRILYQIIPSDMIVEFEKIVRTSMES